MKTPIPCSPLAASDSHAARSQVSYPVRSRRAQRGTSLIELLAVAIILSFLIGATAQFYNVGKAQQRLGQGYSQVQTDLRAALRVATRTIRHGYALKHP